MALQRPHWSTSASRTSTAFPFNGPSRAHLIGGKAAWSARAFRSGPTYTSMTVSAPTHSTRATPYSLIRYPKQRPTFSLSCTTRSSRTGPTTSPTASVGITTARAASSRGTSGPRKSAGSSSSTVSRRATSRRRTLGRSSSSILARRKSATRLGQTLARAGRGRGHLGGSQNTPTPV
ncbi:hypothetical protein PHLGIDRAFT_210719 [Phlebiopsis gigantea 11061_1 CR5-6]|uniref:Uncharacterized protein n=1 Tax=Phlebiopsis gigantea (strain 11061_1 CR5-6) TaxID=745531 RepID=A0A0C3S4L8_PHLG1|nr:hypothetical protein PHLGIDRAFT_210719 [Phlebiopsis gigantea 11061_1 CR5-6]